MEGALLLIDEEHRSSNWRFRQMDSSVGQILSEECVKLLLFCRGEGECPLFGEFGIRMKLYGMVPCLTRGEMGKGFFGEDVCKVFVALWNGALGQMDSLSPGLFCKSLRGGRHGADAFLPFRSEKDHVNRVLLSERRRGGGLSWWGIGFGQNMPIAAGGHRVIETFWETQSTSRLWRVSQECPMITICCPRFATARCALSEWHPK